MDIVWSAMPGSSTTFQTKGERWRLVMTGEALSLEYLGNSSAFFRVLILVDSVPFSFHRHFPGDADVLISESFSETHTVAVKVRQGRQVTGCTGLVNQGDASHANAVLQTLFYLPEIRSQVCAGGAGEALQELFINLDTEQSPVAHPNALLPQMQHTRRNMREFLLRTLEETGSDLFDGTLAISTKADCGCETRVVEPFRDVLLDVRETLEDALRAFFSEEASEEHNCEKHGPRKATRRRAVHEWPSVLALHLKRARAGKEGAREYCKYPFFISLDGFPIYKLYAVTVCEDRAEKTHYFCYVLLDGRWTKFNDCAVTHLNDFEALAFGGIHPITKEAVRHVAQMLVYVRESEWERIFHREDGVLTRIATSHLPRLRLDVSPTRFLTPGANGAETAVESSCPSGSTSGYITKLASTSILGGAGDPGLSFYFSLSDMPRYTALTLFSSEYPSVRLRPIKNDFLFKIQAKLWLSRSPCFFALFHVAEDRTERVDGSVRANGDVFFCISTESEPPGATDCEKRLYFVKRYQQVPVCRGLFPRCLVLSGYVFAGDADFDAVEHFRVEGEEVVRVERSGEHEGDVLSSLRCQEKLEIVVDGIYVVLVGDPQEYLRFREWLRERKCLGGIFVERATRIGDIEGVVQDAFMSSTGVYVDLERSAVRGDDESPEGGSAFATARSQQPEIDGERSVDCVERLCVRVRDTHSTVHVGQGPDNYNEIDHVHPVVVRRSATVESLARKLRRCECLCLGEEFSFVCSRRDSFDLAVMSRNDGVIRDESLIVVQNLCRGRINKVVFTRDGDPCGYPFFLCTEGRRSFGDALAQYGAHLLVAKRGPLLVAVDGDDEMGDEMILVEIGG